MRLLALVLLPYMLCGQLVPGNGATPKEALGSKAVEQIRKQNQQSEQAKATGMSLADAKEFLKLHSADSSISNRVFTLELKYKELRDLFDAIEPARNTRILTETVDALHGVVEREATRETARAQAEREAAQTRHDTWAMVRNIFVMAIGAVVTWFLKWWKLDPLRRRKQGLDIADAATVRNADLLGHVKEVVEHEHREVAQAVTVALGQHAMACDAGKVAASVGGKLITIEESLEFVKARVNRAGASPGGMPIT